MQVTDAGLEHLIALILQRRVALENVSEVLIGSFVAAILANVV